MIIRYLDATIKFLLNSEHSIDELTIIHKCIQDKGSNTRLCTYEVNYMLRGIESIIWNQDAAAAELQFKSPASKAHLFNLSVYMNLSCSLREQNLLRQPVESAGYMTKPSRVRSLLRCRLRNGYGAYLCCEQSNESGKIACIVDRIYNEPGPATLVHKQDYDFELTSEQAIDYFYKQLEWAASK